MRNKMPLTHVNCGHYWNDPRRPNLSARAYGFPFFSLDTLYFNLRALGISSLTGIYSLVVIRSKLDVCFEEISIFVYKTEKEHNVRSLVSCMLVGKASKEWTVISGTEGGGGGARTAKQRKSRNKIIMEQAFLISRSCV